MDYSNLNQQLFDYIKASVTAYQAVAHTAQMLQKEGYQLLCEGEDWNLREGGRYYVTRNGSALLAFRLPQKNFSSFMMAAAHCDSPCFKIKENQEITSNGYVQLSVEKYGGMLCSTWMDRPLSVAGRVLLNTKDGVDSRLVDFKTVTALIPNVAIHMNRSANEGTAYNAAVDMLPLFAGEEEKGTFRTRAAQQIGAKEQDILATDLFLYNPQEGVEWNGFISAPRLDDLQCAFAALTAFIQSEQGGGLPVYCLFDNEEVGSQTKQGAASTFLKDVLLRICACCGIGDAQYRRILANSFLVSCDNAHASHPNHPEYNDKNHHAYLNQGIVIKYNANQRYTSDGVSAAVFRKVCDEAGVPVQYYANRADIMGGSTLGNISNTQVSLNTVDIGLPQLAMHSSFETAGAKDTEYLVRALAIFYEKTFEMKTDGCYCLK